MNITSPSRSHLSQPANFLEALDQDTHPVPGILRSKGEENIGPLAIPTAWYLDRSIHDLEVERIWKRSWQVACREEDLAEVGDTWVYDIASVSLVIVRARTALIKAFYNSCLHRGVTLRRCPGRVQYLQCPFHGFTWNLEGSLAMIPAPHQFPHVNKNDFRLPEVKVGLWGGFVFVNLDPDAEPLEKYLGTLSSHFERLPLDKRVKTLHVKKVFPCNWKLLQEAFMEAWHTAVVHPQFAINAGERCSLQDSWGNFSRAIIGMATTSDLVRDTPTAQKVYENSLGRWDDSAPLPEIPAGATARQAYAAASREVLKRTWGTAIDALSDSELIDVFYYTVFPNFHPFGSVHDLALLFRPYGDDHTKSIMDIMIISPVPPGTERPQSAPVQILDDSQDFTAVAELGFIGPFFSQDIANMGQIMKGLRNNQRKQVVFAKGHELKIRHFYALWQRALGLRNPLEAEVGESSST